MTELMPGSVFLPPLPGTEGLVWLVLTLIVYTFAHKLCMTAKPRPWSNPLLLSALVLIGAVVLRGCDAGVDRALAGFLRGGDWLMLWLGPAMVALALPLYDQIDKIQNIGRPFVTSLIAGSLASAGSAVVLGLMFALPPTTLWALSTKSITSPMAIHLSQELPSDALLAGGLVVVTGVFGSLVAQALFTRLNIRNKAAQGLAVGIAAHGIGSSLLWRRDPEAAAFAALALVINGLLTVFTLPSIAFLLGQGN